MKIFKRLWAWLFFKPKKQLPREVKIENIYKREPGKWFYRFRLNGGRYYGGTFLSQSLAYAAYIRHKETLQKIYKANRKCDQEIEEKRVQKEENYMRKLKRCVG